MASNSNRMNKIDEEIKKEISTIISTELKNPHLTGLISVSKVKTTPDLRFAKVYVTMINENGGNMPGAIGVPEDQLRQAARMAVCKINIDSDLRLAMTAAIRKHFAEHPSDFDPRQYLKPARAAIKEMVRHKILTVLGCNGKA